MVTPSLPQSAPPGPSPPGQIGTSGQKAPAALEVWGSQAQKSLVPPFGGGDEMWRKVSGQLMAL